MLRLVKQTEIATVLTSSIQASQNRSHKNRWFNTFKKWVEYNNISLYFSDESKARMEGPRFKSIYGIINLSHMEISKVISSVSSTV